MPKQNCPYSLYVAPDTFIAECEAEGDMDCRHLGRELTFRYDCPRCGIMDITLPSTYPYVGASINWTCKECYAVMILKSSVPIKGNPKEITLISKKF